MVVIGVYAWQSRKNRRSECKQRNPAADVPLADQDLGPGGGPLDERSPGLEDATIPGESIHTNRVVKKLTL